MLEDPDARVRRSAAQAAGKLQVTGATGRLLHLAVLDDPAMCRASLLALKQLRHSGAVEQAVAALGHP